MRVSRNGGLVVVAIVDAEQPGGEAAARGVHLVQQDDRLTLPIDDVRLHPHRLRAAGFVHHLLQDADRMRQQLLVHDQALLDHVSRVDEVEAEAAAHLLDERDLVDEVGEVGEGDQVVRHCNVPLSSTIASVTHHRSGECQ